MDLGDLINFVGILTVGNSDKNIYIIGHSIGQLFYGVELSISCILNDKLRRNSSVKPISPIGSEASAGSLRFNEANGAAASGRRVDREDRQHIDAHGLRFLA